MGIPVTAVLTTVLNAALLVRSHRKAKAAPTEQIKKRYTNARNLSILGTSIGLFACAVNIYTSSIENK